MHQFYKYFIWIFALLMLGCLGSGEPPFPGEPPQRAIYGTPPPTVNPAAWYGDAKYYGAEIYIYHSPHFQGNYFRRQAGVTTDYAGADLKQVPFLSGIDPAFTPYLVPAETQYQEQLTLEGYRICREQGLKFFYAIPFPVFPVQEEATIRAVHPEWYGEDDRLDLSNPELPATLGPIIQSLRTAMPEMRGIALVMGEGNGNIHELNREDLERVRDWLPALLRTLDEISQAQGLEVMVSAQSIWHNNKTRRETYEIFNDFPNIMLWEQATWPEETTLMPFWGFVAPSDSVLLDVNPVAVTALTDTEFLGKGQMPIVLPRWWRYVAQQAYLQDVELVAGRVFQGDMGNSAANFNRVNLQLLLAFLEDPRLSLKATLHKANETQFGDDFPSRLTSIMLIAEDAIQAISSVNSINLLDDGQFPPPAFLDRNFLEAPRLMKAINDLFEPPGTPLYPEETGQPDTLDAGIHWRWQMEVSAQPVDQYLLTIENAINWLDKIQKEVDYLTLDFSPEHRSMFVDGYRDLLLLGRGMYQFVQGAAVHHRWYRLGHMSEAEAREQLAPIAAQLRLIADEAGDSSLGLRQRLEAIAEAFETLRIPSETL